MYRNLYFDDWDFVTDGRNQVLILWFLAVLGCFWSYFDPLAPPHTLFGVEDGELDP
jgi:hypothetical protein